jgi:hypothetical protein
MIFVFAYFKSVVLLLNLLLIKTNDIDTHHKLHHQHSGNFQNYGLAANASGGFFRDITNENWLLKKNIHCNESHVDLQEGRIMSREAKNLYHPKQWSSYFFATHEPTFSCGYERKIGSRADGGKWICDPHRLERGKCLVYSIGSNDQFDFEDEVHARFQCETHTFDPTCYGKNVLPHVTTFHRLGIVNRKKVDDKSFYSISSLVELLNHANRTIDIFKIDCEGCEWELFDQDFFSSLKSRNMKIRQIQIELHPVVYNTLVATDDQLKIANSLFKLFRDNGYVIFHKEPNNLNVGVNCGDAVEYSFILIEGLDCFQRQD